MLAAADGADGRAMTLGAILDEAPLGRVHFLVLGLCLLAMLIDGYDLFMIGLAVPLIAANFGVDPAAMTGVLMAQSVGLALGTYIAGPVADRFGRKAVLVTCVLAFALLTGLTPWAASVTQFAIIRFVTAMFFAGVIPTTVALITEIAPRRYRSGFVALIFCGFAGGTSLGGVVNGQLIESHGWEFAFWIGGAMGLFIAVPLLVWLPESVRFRARRDPADPRIGALVKYVDPTRQVKTIASPTDREAAASGSMAASLLSGERRRMTLLLWFCFAMSFIVNNSLAAWSATVFNVGYGIAIGEAGVLIGMFAAGGLIGTGTSGFIMDRWGAHRTLIAFYASASILMLVLAAIGSAGPALFVAMFLGGYCFTGAQGALNAFSSQAYPTDIRGTGVGWAFGSGRLGAIVGPLLGGALIGAGYTAQVFFIAMAVPLAIVALATPLLLSAHRASANSSEPVIVRATPCAK